MSEQSIFEKIVAGEIPSYRIWEDDDYLAFLDIHPVCPGQTLVIPKQNIGSYLFDLDEDEYEDLWDASKKCYHCDAVMERAHENEVELPPLIPVEGWEEIKNQNTAAGSFRVAGDQKKLAAILKLKKGIQSLIFPLQIAEQHIGLVVNHLPVARDYKDSEMQFPQAIAAQSAIAIQNALLFSDFSQGFDRLETVLNAVGEGVLMVDE